MSVQMTDLDTTVDKPLSVEQEASIKHYMFQVVIPSAIALSIISAIVGFFINEVARGQAYTKAYGEAFGNILTTAQSVSKSVDEVETLRDVVKKNSDAAQLSLKTLDSARLQMEKLRDDQMGSIATTLLNDGDFRSKIATVSQDELKKLSDRIEALGKTVATMRNSSSISAVNGTDPTVWGGLDAVGGFAGTYSLQFDKVACPPGSFVSGLQGFKPNGQAQGPIMQIRYTCRSLN